MYKLKLFKVGLFFLSIIVAPVLQAYSFMENPYFKIKQGMQKQDVRHLLGEPADRRFSQNKEEWIYLVIYNKKIVNVGPIIKTKVVTFCNERVVSLEDEQCGYLTIFRHQ